MASQYMDPDFGPLDNPNLLQLAGSVDMDKLNRALMSLYGSEGTASTSLVVDLEHVTYIRIECLATLLGEIVDRQRGGLRTKIRLPLSRDVRGFLRDWEFREVFLAATGVSLRDVGDSENRERIRALDVEFKREAAKAGEAYTDRRYGYYDVYETRHGPVKAAMRSRRFLQFRHWSTTDHLLLDDPDRYKRAVLDECDRWLQHAEIRAVLRRVLGEYYQYLPSDVIHEAMSNCFRHGQARTVMAVSDTEGYRAKGRETHLSLVFWDDGIPSYTTIYDRIHNGSAILGSAFEQAGVIHYHVKPPEGGSRRLYSSKDVPTKESTEWETMLATLFPGVTSDPAGDRHFCHPDLTKHLPSDAALPGRGLANLINGAVNVFSGSVAFRSGSYFMNVKKCKKPPKGLDDAPVYSVKFDHLWHYPGNMVTIRLELNE